MLYYLIGASLCFGKTKTLLCEAKNPAGLIIAMFQYFNHTYIYEYIQSSK